MQRPDVFSYEDFRLFLKDFIQYQKKAGRKIKLREISVQAGLSPWYLGKVIRGQRAISDKALDAIAPLLGLKSAEVAFIKTLRNLNQSKTLVKGDSALRHAKRFAQYKTRNLDSLNAHDYLAEWYFPAIRELVNLSEFERDPGWIRKRLKYKIPKRKIAEALDFLLANNLIREEDGKLVPTNETLECSPSVHRTAMAKYHGNMLQLSARAAYDTPPLHRKHLNYVTVLSEKKWLKIREHLDRALDEIVEIANASDDGDGSTVEVPSEVFQISLTAAPLTKKVRK